MGERRSPGLWIAAGILTVLTVAAVLVDPTGWGSGAGADDLTSTTEKASTYYDFEHYARAAETYALAAERGMESGVEWFRYARSVELSSGLDLEKYLTAYRLLLEQSPGHEYAAAAERILTANAVQFSYTDAEQGRYSDGMLMVATGTIARVKPGRVASGVDTLLVDTGSHSWFAYFGDPVRVVAPRTLRYQPGEVVTAIGWYDGWCEMDDGAGIATRYPCIIAAGVVRR